MEMVNMKRFANIVLGFGLSAAPLTATAAGGVWCDAKDANVEFHVKASQSHDGTGGWWGIEGSVQTRVSSLPADLAKFDIKDENLTQRWLDRSDVRLEVQKVGTEKQNFASVRLTIVATALEEADYKGPYELRIRLPDGNDVTRGGIVECSAD